MHIYVACLKSQAVMLFIALVKCGYSDPPLVCDPPLPYKHMHQMTKLDGPHSVQDILRTRFEYSHKFQEAPVTYFWNMTHISPDSSDDQL